MKRPNIVFCLTDDQGYGDLGCHNNSIIQTPNIDKLYGESTHFTDFHTGPTCAPTRAGIMTGHYHNSTGVWHTIGGRSLMRREEITLAEVLGENGYKTGLFGKWHLGDNYPYRPCDRGFQSTVHFCGGGLSQAPDYFGNCYFNDFYKNEKEEYQQYEGYCSDVWTDCALNFIEKNKDENFFCCITYNAPHVPLNVPQEYEDIYKDCDITADRKKYYGMITNIDDNIGRVRKRLEELGIADDTIFVYMSDNGTASGCELDENLFVKCGYNAGMRGTKSHPYEGGHRVPFFLYYKNGHIDTAHDLNELTAYIDFYPTMLDLCGVQQPNVVDGTSLKEYIYSDTLKNADRVVVTDSQRVTDPIKWKDSCVMQNKWRLVRQYELYNIADDPEQRRNVIEEYPEKAAELTEAYEQWWTHVSEKFGKEVPISIGSEREKVTTLCSHDWRGDVDDCVWNQNEVRAGKITNSYMEICVEEDGEYRFELRRWPREANRKLREGFPGRLGLYTGGKAMKIERAKVEIQGQSAEKDVDKDGYFCEFVLKLKKGNTHFRSTFFAEDGKTFGAYYVYVTKINE